MAAYSQFLGVAVKVQYRLGDILLSASGTFVADSGRSIFLAEHVEQHGKRNHLRWEIPYPYIHRIEAMERGEEPGTKTPAHDSQSPPPKAAAARASATGDAASQGDGIISLPPHRNTA